MSVIRVLVVDDSVTIRAMLEEVLGREPDITLVGSAAEAATAVRMIDEFHPQVTTLDIAMPGLDGLALLDAIHRRTHVIMLTSQREAAANSIDRGALGFFPKSEILRDSKRLIKMVHRAAEGKATKLRNAA